MPAGPEKGAAALRRPIEEEAAAAAAARVEQRRPILPRGPSAEVAAAAPGSFAKGWEGRRAGEVPA